MAIKRSKRRKNRKIKFSEAAYIDKNYMVKGKAVIPVKLEKLSDLYMKHDFKQMELSDEICDYIEEIAYMVPINTDIILEIHCPKLDEEEQLRVKKSIKNNYGIEIDDDDYDLSINNLKSGIFLLIGIVLLIINIVTESFSGLRISTFFSYLLSVAWWVCIWDMLEILFGDNTDIKWKRLNHQQLYDAQITFVFDDGKTRND